MLVSQYGMIYTKYDIRIEFSYEDREVLKREFYK